MSISEITGAEGDVISLQDLFVFEREGIGEDGEVLGRFKPTGIRPKFADALKAKGIEFDGGTFLDLEEAPGRRGRSWDRRKTS